MEIRHLRYFVAVAEEENFGRAATRLFISQSTLSQQIRTLEREVGGPLLERTSRRVELTESGSLLLPEARRALLQADHALRLVQASAAGELGSLRIGFSGVAALDGLLGEDLRRFRNEHPAVEVELTEAPPEALARCLVDGLIDVAYTPELGEMAGLRTWRRTPVRPTLAVPKQHPFALLDSVSVTDLADERLIAFASEPGEWASHLLVGISRERLLTASSTLGVLAMVSAGAGVAIVPSVLSCVAMPGVAYVPLGDGAATGIVVAVRQDEPSGTVRELLRISDESARELRETIAPRPPPRVRRKATN